MSAPSTGPPPLRPFGLVLHHDGRFTHEGQPIRNRRLREHFERSVRYLPDEDAYVVTLQHFRGQVVVEEAGFFVRAVDLPAGTLHLSDGTSEPLQGETLHTSPRDGALLCRVKPGLAPGGLLARFLHGPHAALLQAVEPADEPGEGLVLPLSGGDVLLPSGAFDPPSGIT